MHDEFHTFGFWAEITDLKDCDPDEVLSAEEVFSCFSEIKYCYICTVN